MVSGLLLLRGCLGFSTIFMGFFTFGTWSCFDWKVLFVRITWPAYVVIDKNCYPRILNDFRDVIFLWGSG